MPFHIPTYDGEAYARLPPSFSQPRSLELPPHSPAYYCLMVLAVNTLYAIRFCHPFGAVLSVDSGVYVLSPFRCPPSLWGALPVGC